MTIGALMGAGGGKVGARRSARHGAMFRLRYQ
jgi:hypothetical protein